MTAVVANGFSWWDGEERGPRLFVFGCSVFLGALVAAAASSEMSGPWPAFVIGAGAPATINGLLSGVQVLPAAKPEGKPPERGRSAGNGNAQGTQEGAHESV